MPPLAKRIEAAKHQLRDLRVVVLPDFFLDHFVALEGYATFHDVTRAIHTRGGGNMLTGPHTFRLGGNAANTAFALGRLGVPTTLVAKTDPFGLQVIKAAVQDLPVDTSCIQVGDRTSATVALEFHDDGSNVMLSDPGPLVDMAPDDLDHEDGRAWSRIDEADAVVVTNWSQTLAHGTRLLEAVTARAHANDAFTFLDTGDPTHRGDAAKDLLGRALRHVSAWGMNENELGFFARQVGATGTDLVASAEALRRVYGGRIDVHTWSACFSLGRDGITRCGTYRIDPRRLTGSGDAWNAGNLLGELLGLEDEERLRLANAVAALTITDKAGAPPDLQTLVRFLGRPLEERRVGG